MNLRCGIAVCFLFQRMEYVLILASLRHLFRNRAMRMKNDLRICDHNFAAASADDGDRNVDDCDIDGDGMLIEHDLVDRFDFRICCMQPSPSLRCKSLVNSQTMFYGSICSFCVDDEYVCHDLEHRLQ
jgi:hypothetical protein